MRTPEPARKHRRGCTALAVARLSIRLGCELKRALSVLAYEQRRCQDCCPGERTQETDGPANHPKTSQVFKTCEVCWELERLQARLDAVISEIMENWNS